MWYGMCQGLPLDTEDARRWKRYYIMKTMGWTRREYDQHRLSEIDELYIMMKTEQAIKQFHQEKQNARG